jgi:hypothetical protein
MNHSLRNVSYPFNNTLFNKQDEILHKSSELIAFGIIFICLFTLIHKRRQIFKFIFTQTEVQNNKTMYKNVRLEEEINKVVIDYYNEEYKDMPYKRKSSSSPSKPILTLEKEYFPLENVV